MTEDHRLEARLTEDEAKTRWCPMVRKENITSTFHAPGTGYDVNCIGSKCMMWRWEMVELLAPDGQGWADEEPQLEPSTVHGYCGLSGKP